MFGNDTYKNEDKKPEVVEAAVKPVETKKAKSSFKKEEEAIEKQMKELEAKLKADKEKLRLKRKELDLKADKKIAEVVRKWHSGTKNIESLREDIVDVLGER